MPKNLRRITGRNDLHFITFCCYERRALLGSARARNLVVRTLDEVRAKYGFALVGYVIMPEHVHLLISESASVPPAKVIQVFKQRSSRMMRGKKRISGKQLSLRFAGRHSELRRFWQRRYYDFNVYTRKKVWEKLEYMHANPIEEGLVEHPRDWPWSSWSWYATGVGTLKVDSGWNGEKPVEREAKTSGQRTEGEERKRREAHPLKTAKGRPPENVLRTPRGATRIVLCSGAVQ
jgi:putative transposase